MKRTFFTSMAVLMAFNAMAQVIGGQQGETFNTSMTYFGGIPAKYMKDGKPRMLSEDATNESTTVTVYNSDLEAEKTITEPVPESVRGYRLTRELVDGTWTERREYSDFYREIIPSFSVYDYDTFNDGNIEMYLTQTLFNDDDAYEYIRMTYTLRQEWSNEFDNDGDGEADYIETSFSPYPSGIEIVQDNGTVLYTINDVPEGYTLDYPHLMTIDGKCYLAFGYYENGASNYFTRFYSINPGGSSAIKQVATVKGIMARPAIADAGETITVELDGEAEAGRTLTVTNAAGQVVMRRAVPAGEKSVQVSSANFSRGLNIVTVSGGGSRTDNVKVYVK